jgi:hypothetical protein
LAVVDTRGEGISGDYQKDHDLASVGVVEGGLASLEDSIDSVVGGIVHRVVVKVLEEVAFEVCLEEDPPIFRSIEEVLSEDFCVLLVYDVFGFKSEGVDVLLGSLL